MNRPAQETTACPTRLDGDPVLIAHRITPSICQERQRGMYHKCPSCAHYNARIHVPQVAAPARTAAPRAVPVRQRAEAG